MKVILMSDTHQRHDEVAVGAADVVIHAGDFSLDPYKTVNEKKAFKFFLWYKNLPVEHKVLIAGNHDFIFDGYSGNAFVPDGIEYLCGDTAIINGYKVWGGPWTPRFFDWAFNVDRGWSIRQYWDKIPRDTDILITHGPPYGIFDQVGVENVGCWELWNAVCEIKPKLHVFGHIHRPGITARAWVGGQKTMFVNASVVNESYKYAYDPLVIDVE